MTVNCAQVQTEETIERYLLGELSGGEQEAFERHFFACTDCFEDLKTTRALQAELARAESTIRARAAGRSSSWRWSLAAGIALVVLAVGLGRRLGLPGGGEPPSAGQSPLASESGGAPLQPEEPAELPQPEGPALLAELAVIAPPAYAPLTLRGAADEADERFREAMEHYQNEDYESAVLGLRTAAELEPEAANINFFLGVSYLLTEGPGAAIESLGRTVALGDTPYLEEAHFYLAKAHLRTGDPGSARAELQKTRELEGDLETEAARLLDRLQALREAPD